MFFYVRVVVQVGARGRARGGGGLMFDIVALHAGIYRALVYAVIEEEIQRYRIRTNILSSK